MKRTALVRRTPIKSKSQLKAKKNISRKKSIVDYCAEKAKKEAQCTARKPGSRKSRKSARRSADLERHWENVAQMPCMVSGSTEVTLHHCHGGSLKEIGVMPGMAQKSSDWLVIPLAPEYHCVGSEGIDTGKGVSSWEDENGSQLLMLVKIWECTGVNVFLKAGCDLDRVYRVLSEFGVDVEMLAA